MTEKTTFDCIIIGGGLAGMQLALAFCEDAFFAKKQIVIIEPEPKKDNDKTWCFWEKGTGKWDKLITHEWKNASFHGPKKSVELNLGEYSYKMLRSVDFYNFVKKELAKHANITWVVDSVEGVTDQTVLGKKETYTAEFIFDSRTTQNFKDDDSSTTVLQPFKGWVIETEDDQFNPSSFTFMDYRLGHNRNTCFTYVLPISKRKALVEFTFFVPELIDNKIYDEKLKEFIQGILNIESYSIHEVEEGIIPMSSFPFWCENRNGYHKIGTGGGWVKASTGYSFKNVERKVAELIHTLKNNTLPKAGFWQNRFRFYDEVLLNILSTKNEKGPEVFERMYLKNEAHKIFKFLDEETTFAEELKIMWNTNRPLFVKSVIDLLKR